MATQQITNPVEVLENICDLITNSIATIKRSAVAHGDPPLSLTALEPHPIYNRHDENLVRAMKCVSASSQMLKALCDPTTFLNDTIYGVREPSPLMFLTC